MSIEDVETTQWETSDIQTSDVRLAVWLVAYVSLAVSSIVLGDFSTALEMTGASKRFEERGLRFEEG